MLRFAPFWAIPTGMIFGQFAYVYWLKSLRRAALLFAALSSFSFIVTLYYYWAGGPDKVINAFDNLIS
jgi:hypothetical protein